MKEKSKEAAMLGSEKAGEAWEALKEKSKEGAEKAEWRLGDREGLLEGGSNCRRGEGWRSLGGHQRRHYRRSREGRGIETMKEKAKEATTIGSEKADETLHKAKAKAKEVKAKASEKAGEAWDKTKEAASEAKDEAEKGVLSKAKEAAGRLFGSVKDAAEETADKVKNEFEGTFPFCCSPPLIILFSFSLSFIVVQH